MLGSDPAKPAITPGADPQNSDAYDYWDHVDFIIDEANRRGIYIGFLPTRGSWAPNERKEGKTIVFNEQNAQAYRRLLKYYSSLFHPAEEHRPAVGRVHCARYLPVWRGGPRSHEVMSDASNSRCTHGDAPRVVL